MKTVYIAGKYRGANAWEIEQNIRAAEEAGLQIAQAGACPVIPHTMYRFFQGTLPDQFWLDATLELVKRCDGILMIPGWESSGGAVAELAAAQEAGLFVLLGEVSTEPMAADVAEWIKS